MKMLYSGCNEYCRADKTRALERYLSVLFEERNKQYGSILRMSTTGKTDKESRAHGSKKIVIMTVPYGGGHYATAQKVAELLKERSKDVDVEIIDVISDGWPSFAKSSTDAYQGSTANNNAFWFKVYYRLTDRFPSPLKWFASIAFRGYAKRKLKELNPDLMIATFPFLGHVAVKARKKAHEHMPVVTTITDAGNVQGIWLCGSEDAILTATPDTVDYARRRKMGGDRLKFIGFPVNREFYELEPTEAARTALGLKPDVFTVLFTCGGLGMSASKAISLAKRLAQLTAPVQIICVAGRNEKLRKKFESISFPEHITPIILGYVDNMPQLMAASDVVISKSGWLTISEAVAAQKPLFLFDAIPGHEEQNASYVTQHGFGVYEPDPVAMYQHVSLAATYPKQLDDYKAKLAGSANPGTRAELADYFLGLLH